MTGTVAEPRPGFIDGPLRLYIEEALDPYLQSKSIWLDLEAAVPQSGQGISR
jgi:hypothetical protein